MRRMLVPVAGLVAALAAGGCHSSFDASGFDGTYDVMVAAFGKTDPDVVVASAGSDGSILFYFTYGITTDAGEGNELGLRGTPHGGKLELESQPIHVDYATGKVDGTVTGTASMPAGGLSISLAVTPTNPGFVQPDGTTLPAGGTIDYEITGTP